ncbi:MAG TPA: class I SAM-dependent methyltransferase [Plantibacter sp.]|uniref:class I SAM-dependent methyltransferase n=1 Tax=unclassified Plantibacter TaxID=2624265 RepID=UPI002C210DFB|nr:class I SAM-dependent methyltransferase [Plantibacter sp.]
MSSLLIDGASRSEPVFGAGGLAPYERALLAAHRRSTLRLVGALENSPAGGDVIDVATYSDGADTVDRSVLAMTSGAVLDLGCGPGRMVEAAVQLGRTALGVDLSVAALELAVRRGVPVLHASVFDPLPDEGGWGAVLLLDGNVGIGGDPDSLLRRARALVRPDRASRIVVEAHRTEHDRRFEAVLVDDDGRRSAAFPWAQLGSRALVTVGSRSGLQVVRRWRTGGRRFVAFSPC